MNGLLLGSHAVSVLFGKEPVKCSGPHGGSAKCGCFAQDFLQYTLLLSVATDRGLSAGMIIWTVQCIDTWERAATVLKIGIFFVRSPASAGAFLSRH